MLGVYGRGASHIGLYSITDCTSPKAFVPQQLKSERGNKRMSIIKLANTANYTKLEGSYLQRVHMSCNVTNTQNTLL